MSEHAAASRHNSAPEDSRPTAVDTCLDRLLADADEELSQSLGDALDLAGGLEQLTSLIVQSRRSQPSPSISMPTPLLPEGSRSRDDNEQLQEALDLLQHTSSEFHGLLNMTSDGPSSLETAWSKLVHARLVISQLSASAQERTLTRAQNSACFDELHDCLNAVWSAIARTLENPAADRYAVLLHDALGTLDNATQRLTQTQQILEHLLEQSDEDVSHPLPA